MLRRVALFALLAVPFAFSCSRMETTEPIASAREPLVRVRIIYTLDEVVLTPAIVCMAYAQNVSTPFPIEGGTELRAKVSGDSVVLENTASSTTIMEDSVVSISNQAEGGAILIEQVPFGVGWWWEGREDRLYEGDLELRVNDTGKLDVIVVLPVEEYLRGVVPSEIGGTSPMEALKAQAVAARSETMTALRERTYAGPNFDICADVDCQVFSGVKKRTDATDAAIVATRGLIIAHEGDSIPAYYASNCGGFSEDIQNVWAVRDRGIPCWTGRYDGKHAPPPDLAVEANIRQWVTTRPDVYCNRDTNPDLPEWTAKNFRWQIETTADQLTEFVGKKKDLGRVLAIEPIERGPSGRMISVRFVGEKGELVVGPELAIRQVWEPPLKSAAFVVDTKGAVERPDAFVITGAGYGHGVGMCQTGAMARAIEGQDFRQILQHYYMDSEIIAAYE